MSVVVASYSTAEDDGTDLREVARKIAGRKVARFLDGASLAPFVAAATVYRRNPVCDPADVALYTVSGWDGAQPDPPFVPDGSAADDARLGRYIVEDANPTEWLRMLSNNALCQVSIVAGFRGPNAHLVGGVDALWQALTTADADLTRGMAGQALVVAYDPPPGERTNPSGRTHSAAVAVSLAPGPGPNELPALLATQPDSSALVALRGCLAGVGGNPA